MSTSPVTSITDELIEELECEAINATFGPWTADASPVGDLYVSGPCNEFICGAIDHVHDANLIALASPQTILALLAERAELKRDAERLKFVISEGITISQMNGTGQPTVYQCQWHDCRQIDWYPSEIEAIDAAMLAA